MGEKLKGKFSEHRLNSFDAFSSSHIPNTMRRARTGPTSSITSPFSDASPNSFWQIQTTLTKRRRMMTMTRSMAKKKTKKSKLDFIASVNTFFSQENELEDD